MVKTAHMQKEKQPDLCQTGYQEDAGKCAKNFAITYGDERCWD